MLSLTIIIFDCVLALVLQSVATVDVLTHATTKDSGDYEVTPNSCWSTNECLIAANLQFFSGNILPITVNCSTAEKLENVDETPSVVLTRRYENISTVTLDGCGAALNANTFGFEYIPNCGKITSLNLKNFHFDEIYEIICGSGTVLKSVSFEHNEFARISAASIANLKGVEILNFHNNNLRHIDGEAFSGLHRLKEIRLIGEMNLNIRYAKIFKNLHRLEKLYVSGVDRLSSDLWINLPENLDEVTINEAAFDGEEITVIAPQALENLTITNCALTSATIRGTEMLEQLNLSANQLSEFSLENCTHLEVLDLSSNSLTHLQHEKFVYLHRLDYLYLQKNKLKTLSMSIFENLLTHMHLIDLRRNDLKYIDDITATLELSSNLRILIDKNPWNCIWLVNISYRMPEQYRVFRYEKFISKINVNGLECTTYPAGSGPSDLTGEKKNMSFTIVYGAPRESKRNQKAEALVIVFMLPLGIALLFVMLYLWINCQKVFHLSYYRNLPLVRGSAERFDIVRQLPHNNTALANSPNQGYEIPMTGCNCTDHGTKMCTKINLSYEETPHHNAAKIYEEIIDHTTTANCYYDHLKFVDTSNIGESQ